MCELLRRVVNYNVEDLTNERKSLELIAQYLEGVRNGGASICQKCMRKVECFGEEDGK